MSNGKAASVLAETESVYISDPFRVEADKAKGVFEFLRRHCKSLSQVYTEPVPTSSWEPFVTSSGSMFIVSELLAQKIVRKPTALVVPAFRPQTPLPRLKLDWSRIRNLQLHVNYFGVEATGEILSVVRPALTRLHLVLEHQSSGFFLEKLKNCHQPALRYLTLSEDPILVFSSLRLPLPEYLKGYGSQLERLNLVFSPSTLNNVDIDAVSFFGPDPGANLLSVSQRVAQNGGGLSLRRLLISNEPAFHPLAFANLNSTAAASARIDAAVGLLEEYFQCDTLVYRDSWVEELDLYLEQLLQFLEIAAYLADINPLLPRLLSFLDRVFVRLQESLHLGYDLSEAAAKWLKAVDRLVCADSEPFVVPLSDSMERALSLLPPGAAGDAFQGSFSATFIARLLKGDPQFVAEKVDLNICWLPVLESKPSDLLPLLSLQSQGKAKYPVRPSGLAELLSRLLSIYASHSMEATLSVVHTLLGFDFKGALVYVPLDVLLSKLPGTVVDELVSRNLLSKSCFEAPRQFLLSTNFTSCGRFRALLERVYGGVLPKDVEKHYSSIIWEAVIEGHSSAGTRDVLLSFPVLPNRIASFVRGKFVPVGPHDVINPGLAFDHVRAVLTSNTNAWTVFDA